PRSWSCSRGRPGPAGQPGETSSKPPEASASGERQTTQKSLHMTGSAPTREVQSEATRRRPSGKAQGEQGPAPASGGTHPMRFARSSTGTPSRGAGSVAEQRSASDSRLACPAAPPAVNDWLRPAEDEALLACPGTLQERFSVALLRWSGLRASEATALTLADLELTPGRETLTIRVSKTAAGRRTLPLL